MMNLQTNQREITPVNIWTQGFTYQANVLKLCLYTGYDFIQSAGEVHYDLIQHEEAPDGSIFETVLAEGNIPLTYALVANWGVDDQPIFDFVAQELQLTLV
jgi:hypothetical protein